MLGTNLKFFILLLLSLIISSTQSHAQSHKTLFEKVMPALRELSKADTHDRHFEAVEKITSTQLSNLRNIQSDSSECANIKNTLGNNINIFAKFSSKTSLKAGSCLDSLTRDAEIKINQSKLRVIEQLKRRNFTPIFCSESAVDKNTFGPTKSYVIDSNVTHGPLLGRDFNSCELNFTFDDGPHPSLTPELLNILEQDKVLANFFVVGRRVKARPDLILNTATLGHLVGNHTESHANLRKLEVADSVVEIERGFDRIFNSLGIQSTFFRFPYGAATKELRAYIAKTNRTEFFWNIDTLDWKIKDPEELFDYVIEQIRETPKGIILFHDVQPQTIAIMPLLFEALRNGGFKPVLMKPKELKNPEAHAP